MALDMASHSRLRMNKETSLASLLTHSPEMRQMILDRDFGDTARLMSKIGYDDGPRCIAYQ